MSSTIIETLTIGTTTCCNCGVVFGMPEQMLKARRRDGDWFYCPSGHRMHFTKTDADRLREQLEAAQRERDHARARATAAQDQADSERRSHAATKGQLTRVRKRLAIGECPCCHASFPDLATHMAKQHPQYSDDETADAAAEQAAD